MEFFEVLGGRHSVREFLDREVEEEKVRRILEACNSAPSAGNLQAYEIVVVKGEGQKERLAEAALGQGFISGAPVVLVFLASPGRSARKYGERGRGLYCILDAAIAASYAQLAAAALGLGSVWVGAFDDRAVREALDAEGLVPVGIVPIGYPAGKPWQTGRRRLEDIAHRENAKKSLNTTL